MNVNQSRRAVASALALALLAAPAAAHATQAGTPLGNQTEPAFRPNVIVRLPHAIARTRLLAAGGLTVMVHTDQPGAVLVGVQDAGRRERGFTARATKTPGWVRLKVALARPRTWALGNRIHVHVTVHPVGDPAPSADDPGSRARRVDRWVHVVGASGSPPSVRVHAIFGGHGAHVGQVLYVVPSHGAMTQLCWYPAPIDRPACSRARMGAPSAVGKTRLVMRLADGSLLSRVIRVAPAYTRTGGHGGSDAVAGHVGCPTLRLNGNPGPLGYQIGTLTSDAAIAIYNRVRDDIFVWHYADNTAGFADPRCAKPGLAKHAGTAGP